MRGRKSFTSPAALARIGESQGAGGPKRKQALSLLDQNLEEVANKITKRALLFAAHLGHKRLTAADIDLAVKYL